MMEVGDVTVLYIPVSYKFRASGLSRRGLANLLCYRTGTAVETLSLVQARSRAMVCQKGLR